MRSRLFQFFPFAIAATISATVHAQVNSGSDGSDGAFNVGATVTVDMSMHPDGIYRFTSVHVPGTAIVSFKANERNTPVIWLVQGDVTIDAGGVIYLTADFQGTNPGGFPGGIGGDLATAGDGPGGGEPARQLNQSGALGSYGDGKQYGNQFLVPLLGGSGGGGGSRSGSNGGAGGGAILIAASGTITVNGTIVAGGGQGQSGVNGPLIAGGAGSGGAIRLIASRIDGTGSVLAFGSQENLGLGRIRMDSFDHHFSGTIRGTFSKGYQPIIVPSPSQGTQLSIESIGGISVVSPPSGLVSLPDAIIAAQQANPIAVVVRCSNLPLNTPLTITIKPASGTSTSATTANSIGSAASSTATAILTLPRGGGQIYATAEVAN
jgi:hypothetical protein